MGTWLALFAGNCELNIEEYWNMVLVILRNPFTLAAVGPSWCRHIGGESWNGGNSRLSGW